MRAAARAACAAPSRCRRSGADCVEREHPCGLGFVVGIGTGLPGPGALEGQAGLREDPPEMRRGDLHDRLLAQVTSQPPQRPARCRDPERLGTGTGHRDDPSTLLVGDPAGTPAPRLRVQRAEPPLVECVNDVPNMRLISPDKRRDLRRPHLRRRGPHDQRPLTLDLAGSLARQTLQPVALLGQQIPDEHRHRTHHHLQTRDASLFATDQQFPANTSETHH